MNHICSSQSPKHMNGTAHRNIEAAIHLINCLGPACVEAPAPHPDPSSAATVLCNTSQPASGKFKVPGTGIAACLCGCVHEMDLGRDVSLAKHNAPSHAVKV